MATNATSVTKKRTPTERLKNKQRIAADKARATCWASQRRLLREQVLPPTVQAVHVPDIPVILLPENLVLQDLLTKRAVLIKELKDLDTAIAVINRMYAR